MKRQSPPPSNGVHSKQKLSHSTDSQPATSTQNQTDPSAQASESLVLRSEIEEAEGGGIRCLHEVSYPAGYQPKKPKPAPHKPAKEYPFTLDPFQLEAVRCLEAGESVLVSAHTSAGKTVVAEYAIAMCLREKQRVIYTSPIKALSNQKYRELSEEFADVGLMTGDVTIATNASCLVMTTEILRSMLYRGSEAVREVGWIIFDEVHYMRDRERGVVWEESIIMAPKTARFVFLSATVPNAREFADWVAKVHRRPCHIVYTDFRPTPLQHYIFPAGGRGLHLVVDERGKFREDNFQKAIAELGGDRKEGGGGGGGEKGKGGTDGPTDIFKIVKMLMQRQYDPVIVFSFSKTDCEALAQQMTKLDLNDEDEKKVVSGIFSNAIDSLSADDRRLPQVTSMLPLLRRGVGIHHSGLLPILKEVIEILFQEGLLKCLFATETFSIGLNMPAKTVVFTGVRKWDGTAFRWLSGGEYVQMSGRAGRRGLDDKGVCVLMLDAKMEPQVAKGMVRGSADPLDSAFHLSYNLVLNQMRSEESEVERLIQSSFAQFQAERSLPSLQLRLAALEAERASISIAEEAAVAQLVAQRRQLRGFRHKVRQICAAPFFTLPYLSPGRLVRILCRPYRDGGGEEEEEEEEEEEGVGEGGEELSVWGVVVNYQRGNVAGGEEEGGAKGGEVVYTVDVLTRCTTAEEGVGGKKRLIRPCLPGEKGEALVAAMPLEQIERLSAIRIKLGKELRGRESREAALKALQAVVDRFPDGIQMLDPEEDMKVDLVSFRKAVRKAEALEGLLEANPLRGDPLLPARVQALRRKQALAAALKGVGRQAKAAGGMILKDELKARKRVLRRLGYCSSEEVVELKGRVACEVSTADELVMTELIFSNTFQELTPEQAAALVSCFVWQEKTKEGPSRLREQLAAPLAQLRDVARRVAKVQLECKVAIDVEEYVNRFRSDLMEATFSWCHGAKFGEVLKMTDGVFEGSLIRALRRLEEVLRQLVAACRAIGEETLEAKFQQAITLMKRDIVFAASLYL